MANAHKVRDARNAYIEGIFGFLLSDLSSNAKRLGYCFNSLIGTNSEVDKVNDGRLLTLVGSYVKSQYDTLESWKNGGLNGKGDDKNSVHISELLSYEGGDEQNDVGGTREFTSMVLALFQTELSEENKIKAGKLMVQIGR